ncbi:MAG: N-formylglutamate deformylase [Lysobacterales bacterium]|jgi:N-formylglutamate deformylase
MMSEVSQVFKIHTSRLPLLVSVPHAGTRLPSSINGRLSPKASMFPDTDWFVDRLYEWVPELGAGLITANYSRYVVDLNRSSNDAALYENKTPGLIPIETFSGLPLYQWELPDAEEIKKRVEMYWQPYHLAIKNELARLKETFGYAILIDAHSIRSRVPGLFDGVLPDLNLGSFEGRSAAPSLTGEALNIFRGQNRYSHVVDGRFKGGFITRHYGCPALHIHALQLEMSQDIYMHKDTLRYDEKAAGGVQEFLKHLIVTLLAWKPGHGCD